MLPDSAGFLLGSLFNHKDGGYVPPKRLHIYCHENIKYNNYRTDSLAVWPAFGFRFVLCSSPQLHKERCKQTEYK
jgi:hypothetical protein